MSSEQALDAWVDAHFDEEVRFLQQLVQVPTDTPPGRALVGTMVVRDAAVLEGAGSR